MAETTALMGQVLSAETEAGKYIMLYLLSLFIIGMVYRQEKTEKFMVLPAYGMLACLAACFPPLLWMLMQKLGVGVHYREYLWLMPILPVIAYAAVLLCQTQQEAGRKRLCAAACLLLIALSGTVLPWHGDEAAVKVKYADANLSAVMEEIIAQKEFVEGPVLLLAQQEIMEQVRRLDGEITLLYGKDMWMPEANTAVADVYSQDAVYAYERMKKDYEYPDEMAQLAEHLDCNVLVLREKISWESEQHDHWVLAAETPGYVVYRISK